MTNTSVALDMVAGLPLEERMSRQIRLRAAVLIEAIRCLEGTSGTRGERLLLQRQAIRWFRGAEVTSPFSFQRVCESLGFDASRVRRAVFRRCLCPEEASEVQQLVQEIISRGIENAPCSTTRSVPAALRGSGRRRTSASSAAAGPTSDDAPLALVPRPDEVASGLMRYARRALNGCRHA
jgi:hypothetical protein